MLGSNVFDRFIASLVPDGADSKLATRLRPLASLLQTGPGSSARLEHGEAHYVWIARGNAKLVAEGAGGRHQVVEFHYAGDLVLVPARGAQDYSLDAITACEMVAFRAADLQEAAGTDAALALALLSRMTGALGHSRDSLVTLGRKRAKERIAGFLLSILDRVGYSGEAIAGAKGGSILLPMSRRDIGDNLAITVESISREVGRLRRARLIDTPARAKICILDPEGLADLAGNYAGGV